MPIDRVLTKQPYGTHFTTSEDRKTQDEFVVADAAGSIFTRMTLEFDLLYPTQ
jgi:hypothetical protein